MSDAMKNVAICAESVRANLGNGLARQEVLHGVTLSIAAGKWTSIVGPNGAGKSTLLKCLAGLMPFTGSVEVFGRDLFTLAQSERARTLAWLGQNESSADDLTVWDVAMLGRMPHQAWLAAPSPKDRAVVEESLRLTQAWDWRCRPLGQLSGGERQRVLLARALAVQAPVLLMDEPVANLDPPHQSDWLSVVKSLVVHGVTVVSVLHEIGLALHADQVVVMERGRLCGQGPSGDSALHGLLTEVFANRISIHQLNGQWLALPC